jgi:hypothetical protein
MASAFVTSAQPSDQDRRRLVIESIPVAGQKVLELEEELKTFTR